MGITGVWVTQGERREGTWLLGVVIGIKHHSVRDEMERVDEYPFPPFFINSVFYISLSLSLSLSLLSPCDSLSLSLWSVVVPSLLGVSGCVSLKRTLFVFPHK